jgi:hypothetical protein
MKSLPRRGVRELRKVSAVPKTPGILWQMPQEMVTVHGYLCAAMTEIRTVTTLKTKRAEIISSIGTVKANKYRPFSASNPAERVHDS